jgi:bifunctional non-homologous end joining protein LigD
VGAGWRHEVKFDGYRIQARLDHGEVRLLTRKGLDWAGKFAEIATAVAKLPAETALLDGELVVEEASGVSSFSALQGDLKAGRRDRFVYYVFDLLHLDSADLTALPLTQRQAALAGLLRRAKQPGAIRLSEPFEDDGTLVLQQACRMKLEGIVSKRADAPYVSGRSESWIKAKCANRQELVVVGYAVSSVMRDAIGALVVGYYEDGKLRYGGRVGTGYSQAMAKELWRRLQPLKAERPPIDPPPPQERLRRDVVWVAPRMVIEANFRDWTADRLVRQAAFKGIREDKPAKEVAREAPMPAKASVAKKASKRPAPPRKSAAADDVHLTHPDRVYWVDVGVTKQDLADYYRAVWDWMAPQLIGRPLALVRCPEGTKGQCFFQKHASAGLSEKSLRTLIDAKGRQIIAVDDLDGLISLVQAGVLEIHVRGAMLDRLEVCDRIVFDLDPGEGVAWSAMVAAAREVRERLDAVKLESFVKLSGGKGLHVVLPIDGADWDSAKTFAQAVALAMAADDPTRYLAKITKSLRKGKIFVDYLRNSLEQTSVAAYSTRARAGAPVSVPVAWPELGRTTSGSQYTVLDLTKRLGRLKQDPWVDIGRVRQQLPDAAKI